MAKTELQYSIHNTKFGYMLQSSFEKLVMNKSKRDNDQVPYYLKRVEPDQEYITGLFWDPKKQEYHGKDRQGRKLTVRLGLTSAIIIVN